MSAFLGAVLGTMLGTLLYHTVVASWLSSRKKHGR